MAMNKVGTMLRYPNGDAVPLVYQSGLRVTGTVTEVSTEAAALPTGASVVEVRATEPMWIRFGASDMDAAAADDDSTLFPAGEKVVPVPIVAGVRATHVRVLRAGDTSGAYQVEQISVVDD